jgi:hypothetical protein
MVAIRVRSLVWFVTGAMLATAVSLMFVHGWRADAAPGDTDTTFVPITPGCRFTDTREPGQGPAVGAGQTRPFTAHGTNGDCTIPSDAVALLMNITIARQTAANSFITVWGNGPNPGTSALNPANGEPPTPNAVTTDLTPTGEFNVYNNAGFVDVIIDVNGYYTKSSLTELASRVAALEDRQPFTVASDPIDFTNALSTPTEIRSVTITAPVAGHVATAASASMGESTDGQAVVCGLMDSVTDPPNGARLVWQSPTGGDNSHLSATRVFDIAAGATATYYLVCRNANGGSSGIDSPQVTAIFTPAP